MIIEIKNFGPIDYLKFDISKDLSLIYGKNSIGKSYATYCIYCLIKNLKYNSLTNAYNEILKGRFEQEYKPLFDKYTKKTNDIKDEINYDISEDIIDTLESILSSAILEPLKNSLSNTFSSIQNLKNGFSNKCFELIISLNILNYQISIKSSENFDLSLKISAINDSKALYFEIIKLGEKFSIQVKQNKIVEFYDLYDFYLQFSNLQIQLINSIFDEITSGIEDVYYLPASRSGLYQALNSFAPMIAELSQNRSFLKSKTIKLPSLSEPVADYFLDLSTIDTNNINSEYVEIINVLEQNILNGEVQYDKSEKNITFAPSNLNLKLNLSQTSSMVSEISPLVLYLKHILGNKIKTNTPEENFLNDRSTFSNNKQKSNILFIEEPEAHLHPEAQIKLVEAFSLLTKQNIKLFITSHSEYMFSKVNNMILSNQIDSSEIEVYHLVGGENGTVQNMEMNVEEDGIEDDNFQSVSVQLYEERIKILNDLNERTETLKNQE